MIVQPIKVKGCGCPGCNDAPDYKKLADELAEVLRFWLNVNTANDAAEAEHKADKVLAKYDKIKT